MKTLIATLLASALTFTASAGDKPNQRTIVVLRAKPVAVTGTNIARPVKRIGKTYDTPQSVYVIDRRQIERSGARDLSDLLHRAPFVR
jgi:outer membrane cobalamin receptor